MGHQNNGQLFSLSSEMCGVFRQQQAFQKMPAAPSGTGANLRLPCLANVLRLPQDQAGVLSHTYQAGSSNKIIEGKVYGGLSFSITLTWVFSQFGIWTNNCHGNHYVQQFVFFAHFLFQFCEAFMYPCWIYFLPVGSPLTHAAMLNIPHHHSDRIF